ncbi:MAG: alpha/beta hydrolase [Deltaproteobacteria bacterium]|nr:alpha/beta hydrolase [Deltaproteobacteria bacterium]
MKLGRPAPTDSPAPLPPRRSELLGLGPHGFHRLSYAESGRAVGRPVVCVHGLTRNARDFEDLAAALSPERRVVCPDMPGRGRSEWLSHPLDYSYPVYLSDLNALIARLDVGEVDWVGTSMGGILGMMLAAQPGSPVRRLVLNDIGPFVPAAALARIASYVGAAPGFRSLGELETYLRVIHAPFGPLTGREWARVAERSAERLPSGGYRLCYDPSIAVPLRLAPPSDVDLWSVWEAVTCPVLVLRGAESDVLTSETAKEMKRRGPRARVVEFGGVGHAPALMAADQVGVVRDWLVEDWEISPAP